MCSASANRLMVSAPAPSSSKIRRAASTVSTTRGERAGGCTGRSTSPGRRLTSVGHFRQDEHRVIGANSQDVLFRGVGAHTVEEDTNFHLPSPEVRTKYRRLFAVGQLAGDPLVTVSAEDKCKPAAVG